MHFDRLTPKKNNFETLERKMMGHFLFLSIITSITGVMSQISSAQQMITNSASSDINTDRELYRHTENFSDIQRTLQTYRELFRHTENFSDIQTDVQTYRRTDVQTYRRADVQTYRRTDVQTDGRTDGRTDRQTDRHTQMHYTGTPIRGQG